MDHIKSILELQICNHADAWFYRKIRLKDGVKRELLGFFFFLIFFSTITLFNFFFVSEIIYFYMATSQIHNI